MEALYTKLYDKYTKLKTKRESESEKLHRDQESKFVTYVSAADELIEHLKSENERLRAQVDDLRSEVASIRSTKDNQHAEDQKLFMEENQKNKELAQEIKRLQDIQEVGSDRSRGFAVMTRKRSRYSGTDTEATVTPCASDQLEHTSVKESASSTLLNIEQLKCCRRKIGSPGGDVNDSCMFQELVECLVGMKLSIATQTDEICISAVHQSSGYSFSLTWTNDSMGETELVYRVLSLGTFERVAPEWMREEVLMFSLRMCPIFFERVSRVIKLY